MDAEVGPLNIDPCCVFFRKGDTIYTQMKRLGMSVDWDRECFTMDRVSITAYTLYQ